MRGAGQWQRMVRVEGRSRMKPRYGLLVVIGLFGLLLPGAPAHAVEYRLLVASVFDTALTSLVTVKDLSDGATGPGLVRLATGLDTGEIDGGAVPPGRSLTSVPDSIARAWGGVAIPADIPPRAIPVVPRADLPSQRSPRQ